MADSPPRTPLGRSTMRTPKYKVDIVNSGDEGNEENALNFANTPRSSARRKAGNSPFPTIARSHSQDSDGASEISVAHLKGWLNDFEKQNRDHFVKGHHKRQDSIRRAASMDSSEASDSCDTDLSVAKLKGWLDDFGKKQRAHYEEGNSSGRIAPATKPALRAKSQVGVPTKQQSVTIHADPVTVAAEAKKGPTKTPVRYKPRIKRTEVQATNDGYASVKKIAAWLADDPTADKKTTTVRKGINVINKSRKFEKDLEDVIIEENRIVKGSVHRKKEQFSSSPAEQVEMPEMAACLRSSDKRRSMDGDISETASCISVSDKKKWLEGAFRKPSTEVDVEEEDDDNSIVSMSVLDKKQWLQNAFKSSDGGGHKSSAASSHFRGQAKRAESAPGGPTMTKVRNEKAVSSAKLKFQERSASRRALSDTSDPSEAKSSHSQEEVDAAKVKWQQHAVRRSVGTSERNKSIALVPTGLPATQTSHPAINVSENWQQLKTSIENSPGEKGVIAPGSDKQRVQEKDSEPDSDPVVGPPESGFSPQTISLTKRWQQRKAMKRNSLDSETPFGANDEEASSVEGDGVSARVTKPSATDPPGKVMSRASVRVTQKWEKHQESKSHPLVPEDNVDLPGKESSVASICEQTASVNSSDGSVSSRATKDSDANTSVKTKSRVASSVTQKWEQRRAMNKDSLDQESVACSKEKFPTAASERGSCATKDESTGSEQEEALGFLAARQKLVQRSAKNGNPVNVLSKVQKRKQKFERIEQEMRRRTNPKGLLKPTWEQAAPTEGPTTAYKKTFVDNIAPKKSFGDLP